MEVLVGLFIAALLATLFVAIASHFSERAEAVKCANNLKSLHVSLAGYLQDVGHWPQEPNDVWASNDNDAYEDWWIATLKPFGATEKVWQCPTIYRKVTSHSSKGRPKVHYTPTMFDDKPYTPYKWSTQPWLVEIGNMHGQGALIGFPDGSVKPMDDVMKGQ